MTTATFAIGDRVIYGHVDPSSPYGWSSGRRIPLTGRVVGVEPDGTVLVHGDSFCEGTPPYRCAPASLALDDGR